MAERSGLITPLTTQVLDSALAACAEWRAAGHDIGIAVTLSTRSLHDTELTAEMAGLLHRHGVPAGALTLEVTEGSVMADVDRAVAVLDALRDIGVRLSVDDFGTGYSSLSYLKRLPVGAEDQPTWDLLTAMGCDLVQGFHLARPMPTDTLLPWLTIRAAPVQPALPQVALPQAAPPQASAAPASVLGRG